MHAGNCSCEAERCKKQTSMSSHSRWSPVPRSLAPGGMCRLFNAAEHIGSSMLAFHMSSRPRFLPALEEMALSALATRHGKVPSSRGRRARDEWISVSGSHTRLGAHSRMARRTHRCTIKWSCPPGNVSVRGLQSHPRAQWAPLPGFCLAWRRLSQCVLLGRWVLGFTLQRSLGFTVSSAPVSNFIPLICLRLGGR